MTDVPLRLYNTMSRRLEEFEPIDKGHVRLYTCGPTVYDFAHIGNLRSFLFEDVLRRTLKLFGYDVTQVMNLTDIDDKTIREAKAAGLELRDYDERTRLPERRLDLLQHRDLPRVRKAVRRAAGEKPRRRQGRQRGVREGGRPRFRALEGYARG
jgi:cysteinyl-tRNA synthetase